jgi:hypothetical protein
MTSAQRDKLAREWFFQNVSQMMVGVPFSKPVAYFFYGEDHLCLRIELHIVTHPKTYSKVVGRESDQLLNSG